MVKVVDRYLFAKEYKEKLLFILKLFTLISTEQGCLKVKKNKKIALTSL